MARTLFVTCHTGFVGMDAHYLLIVEDDATAEQIANEAYELALDNASMYGIEPYPEDFEDGQDDEGFSENIEGSAVPYDPEQHNGHLFGYEEGYIALPD